MDVEGQPAPREPKKRRLFFLFLFLLITWCTILMWVMQRLVLTEHQRLDEGYDYKGADIDSVYGVKSASACSRECEKHPICLAFTYVKSEEACWLKGEGYVAKSNPNTVSGQINATLAVERRKRRNSSRWMSLAGQFAGDDEEGEQLEEDGYAESTARLNHVWPHEEEGELYRPGVQPTEDEVQRYEDATSFFGDVVIQTDVRSATECESICLNAGQCVAWTVDKFKSLCVMRLLNASLILYDPAYIGGRLSDEQIAARAAQPGQDRISPHNLSLGSNEKIGSNRTYGSIDDEGELADSRWGAATAEQVKYTGPAWPLPPEYKETLDNIDLRGADLNELSQIDSVSSCAAACAAASNCSGWTLRKPQGICYLKRSGFTQLRVNKTEGLISGILPRH
ncbi:hypothetical protein AB1Y20_001375 [Prymnesium parvum]|uniref:Apple domain-containing protein n=1 Tax=Prymnesium parvum TaxID=97485 RepID=A0AB34KBJ1_PRYPA